MEAVQEMKVQVHTYDAEMGRTGGGVMNMSAKSGSNSWKGSGYTVYRPTGLSEQLLIPRLQGQKFVPEEWKNGGGGFGGPREGGFRSPYGGGGNRSGGGGRNFGGGDSY